ncbi:MAG: cytochrome-c peroxidase [Planctomycetota bacterium]
MKVLVSFIVWLVFLAVLAGCGDESATTPARGSEKAVPEKGSAVKPPAKTSIDPVILASFQPPLPDAIESPDNPITAEKVALGKMLYHDKRLSKSQEIACNSCHLLTKSGVDNQPTSPGHNGQLGTRNSPTVYNAAGHLSQFWDGRAETVEEQAKGPVLNPVEMAMPDETYVLQVLNSILQYVEMFKAAFPGAADPVTYDNMAKAIGAFERKLVTPSRWDDFLMGNHSALTDAEKQGFNDFVDANCIQCHTGTYVGGNSYQKAGNVIPWPNQKDFGRFDVTKKEADKFMFKVPSLRNVEKTSPYFHDGSVKDLHEAVKMMAYHQTGKQLAAEKIDSIVTFLKSLTGKLPADDIAEPTLPPSTEQTPKPDKS